MGTNCTSALKTFTHIYFLMTQSEWIFSFLMIDVYSDMVVNLI